MLHTTTYRSPVGWLEISGTEAAGIRSIRFTDEPEWDVTDLPPVIRECLRQLDAYFARQRRVFDLPLDWSDATPFNRAVWEALLEIPYGHTTSYAAVAERIGHPKAVRAVGLANRNNPIAIVVPCHRVIGKSGDLTGYFYGLDTKLQLLRLENPAEFAVQGSLF